MINEELRWKKGVTEIARRLIQEKLFDDVRFSNNLQTVHTPYSLCKSMISKLKEYCDFTDKKFLVLNLEFVEVLMYDFDVDRSCIWYVTDCEQKKKVAERFERYKVNAVCGNFLYMEEDMKFDVVIGNPPYQDPIAKSNKKLWDKFLKKSTELVKDNGFLAFITPFSWATPANDAFDIFQENEVKYVNLDGKKFFPTVGTTISWYIIEKTKNVSDTVFEYNNSILTIDLKSVAFLPSILDPDWKSTRL